MKHELDDINWRFPLCPAPPDYEVRWEELAKRFACIDTMSGCPQDPRWHAEGDVFTHVGMVCKVLAALPEWRALPAGARNIVFAATALHDIGKPATTAEEDGRLRSRGHALLGARMARLLLASDDQFGPSGTPFAVRQAIVALVRHHGLPATFIGKPDIERATISAAVTVRCDWVAMVAEADARGRICLDPSDAPDSSALFADFARECGCERAPYAFSSGHSRFKYFRTADTKPTIVMPERSRCEVTMMSGLPASGKNHWISHHAGELPVVSLDDLREEMEVDPDEDQGPVINKAKAQAKTLLRDSRDFVWNATNTSKPLREGLIDLFAAYDAKVRIVYVESPWRETLARNAKRTTPVPLRVMERLRERLDVPNETEAHEVVYVV